MSEVGSHHQLLCNVDKFSPGVKGLLFSPSITNIPMRQHHLDACRENTVMCLLYASTRRCSPFPTDNTLHVPGVRCGDQCSNVDMLLLWSWPRALRLIDWPLVFRHQEKLIKGFPCAWFAGQGLHEDANKRRKGVKRHGP